MTRRQTAKTAVRLTVVLLLAAGGALALREWRQRRPVLDLPTAIAKRGDFQVIVRCRGELIADRTVQLQAPLDVPDLQIVWLATPGGIVKAGDPVARFDPSKLKEDEKDKIAALKQAQASLDQQLAAGRITADQDQLDLSKARYETEKARLEASKQDIVSPIQGAESKIDLGLAEEKVKVQQSTTTLNSTSNDAKIASLVRLRDQARDELELVRRRLSQLEIHTPINGVVTLQSNYTQGWMNAQPFKVGDHAFPGATIAEIPDLSTLQVESKLEEADRGRIRVGNQAVIHVDAFPELTPAATVVSISPLTEESFNEWPRTRSFRAYAAIQKPDSRMRPAMNAGADIVERTIPNAISVPAKALFTLHGKAVVYVKSDQSYVPAEVKVLARNPDEVAVEGIPAKTAVALADPNEANK
jgi:multidrug efflux pump subunit AcrA (membrane-fusion protein)